MEEFNNISNIYLFKLCIISGILLKTFLVRNDNFSRDLDLEKGREGQCLPGYYIGFSVIWKHKLWGS